MNARLLFLSLVLCTTVAGCALQHRKTSTDRSMITRDQLDENRFSTAFEAVQSLHSNWLQPRGPDSFNTPSIVLVYFDNVRLGGIETMRGVNTKTISYIRHYDALEATSRWGVGHSAGVILLSSHPLASNSGK